MILEKKRKEEEEIKKKIKDEDAIEKKNKNDEEIRKKVTDLYNQNNEIKNILIELSKKEYFPNIDNSQSTNFNIFLK